jgi:SAM-dependent methyltransferase
MTAEPPPSQAEHTRLTRDAYDRLAPVWASTTDDGPFNGLLERPALRSLVPRPLAGKVVLDAGCGSGAQCEWLLNEGADVIGIDLSPAMVEETKRRCGQRARIFVADLAEPLPLEPGTLDGITCSLALHYLRHWDVPLHSFRGALRSTGWLVLSLDHPFGPSCPIAPIGHERVFVGHVPRGQEPQSTKMIQLRIPSSQRFYRLRCCRWNNFITLQT